MCSASDGFIYTTTWQRPPHGGRAPYYDPTLLRQPVTRHEDSHPPEALTLNTAVLGTKFLIHSFWEAHSEQKRCLCGPKPFQDIS